MYNGELVEKLEAGIYAIVEFIEKDSTVLHHDENKIRRVHFRVIKNLCIFFDIETFLGVKF